MAQTESRDGIEAHGLVREFKNGPRAVDGVDLAVAPGEIYGFLGPNGAGKSTTVHMLTTLLPPTAGTATVAGHDIVRDGPAVRDAIGVALQEAALDLLLSGSEHMSSKAGFMASLWRRSGAGVTPCWSGSVSPRPPNAASAPIPAA